MDELVDIYGLGLPRDKQDALQAEIALRGILPSIETAAPSKFLSPAALRAHLLEVCSYASLPKGDVRDDPHGEPEARSAERERFRLYVTQLTGEEAEHLERVPARRVLEATERRSRLQRIARAWPSGEERCHPHTAVLGFSELVAVHGAWVGTDALPLAPMRRVLAEVAGAQIWELQEGSPWRTDDVRAYMGVQLADPSTSVRSGLPATSWTQPYGRRQRGTPSVWASSRLDWLLYAHHEGPLYVAGAPLVRHLAEIWPAWEQRAWEWGVYPAGPSSAPAQRTAWLTGSTEFNDGVGTSAIDVHRR